MDIGLCSLRRMGLNVLHNALHPRHGLTWTDGSAIYLVPINITEDEIKGSSPMKLGEFDHVSSLHWSSDTGESYSYLCVVHSVVVSLWKVDGSFPKLSFKQIRKIHASPILQGCLWNPKRDILCIMNKEQCTFYFKHLNKRGSYSLPPMESGKISCGCWTLDGTKLIVGMKSIILVYQWVDIDHSLNDYTIIAWKIPNIHGSICTLAPLSDSRILCSAEVCLDKLCKTNGNLFDMPDMTPEPSIDWSLTDDEDVIKPKTTQSVESYTESLLHLKPYARKPSSDSYNLVLFELQANNLDPVTLHSINVSGMLSPDLLHCDNFHSMVVIGSNCHNSLHVYKIVDDEFHQLQTVTLAPDERPKGVCSLPADINGTQEGFLIMVGKIQHSDPVFLPSSLDMEYTLKLCFRSLLSDQKDEQSLDSTLGVEHEIQRDVPYSHSAMPNSQVDNVSLAKSMPSFSGELSLTSSSGGMLLGCVKSIATGQLPLSRVGSSPGLAPSIGPLEERLRGLHCRSSSTQSTAGIHSVAITGLLLPGHDAKSSKSKTGNIETFGDNGPKEGLETEVADFMKQQASFNNTYNIQKLREEDFFGKRNTKAKMATRYVHDVLKSSCVPSMGNDQPSSGMYGSVSSLDVSQDGITVNGTAALHRDQEHKVGYTDPSEQLAVMEKQLASQEIHISELQKRVNEISRLLDEARSSSLDVFKPVSKPDIVYLNYVPRDDRNKSFTKAFILDNGRLQLDSVREAFELSTVEIIVDGMACVVGANAQGYMPVAFQHKDTVNISGKLIRTASVPSGPQTVTSVGAVRPAMLNGDVSIAKEAEQAVQPDVTANHQTITSIKPSSSSSTYC